MDGNRALNLEILFWDEQRAIILDLLHAVEVVGLLPDGDRETVEAITDTLRAILREVEVQRSRLKSGEFDERLSSACDLAERNTKAAATL
jgi:hypothetical protein